MYTTDATLPNHTLYLPSASSATTKLPILIWGNGGCVADGTAFSSLLTQIASHGVFVVASGAPGGRGSTTAALMTQALDWVSDEQQARTVKYPGLERRRIAVAGQSCGGVEAYAVVSDARVGALGMFNSGLMTEAESRRVVPGIKGKPVFYFLGGSGDVAYVNVSFPLHTRSLSWLVWVWMA